MADLGEDEDNIAISERAERLREALANAGGAAAVAKRVGMPPTTISNYVAGRDMKCSALVALADACHVSLEWLATGRGDAKAVSFASIPKALQVFEGLLPRSANFFVLITLIRSCQEWFDGAGVAPSLADVFNWVGPLYETGYQLPDLKLSIQPIKDE